MYCAGRGSGKTRAGAEWVRDQVENKEVMRVGLIGPTAADVRDVMCEGEALEVMTPLRTQDGWSTVGAVQVGTRIYTQNGSLTDVVAKTDVFTDRPCYTVTVSGAEPITVDANHQWVVSSKSNRANHRKQRTKILTTEELFRCLGRGKKKEIFSIPATQPIQQTHKQLPVPPYTYGAWCGDGSTRATGAFAQSIKDSEVIDRIRQDGYVVTKGREEHKWHIQKLVADLRKIGLNGGKHIPQCYLQGSVQQRIDLIRGLMDTDGSVDNNGTCTFHNTNRQLIDSVWELAVSLGYIVSGTRYRPAGWVTIKGKLRLCNEAWDLRFRVHKGSPTPFFLARKRDRVESWLAHMTRRQFRHIKSIVPTGRARTQCLQVSHPSGTFLAGRGLVVTHNSGIIACSTDDFMPKYEPSKRRLLWPSGACAMMYSAEEPERLRGPQHEKIWADELAAWKDASTFDMAVFGLRLGRRPQMAITTTPRPTPFVKRIMKLNGLVRTGGSMMDNKDNLPDSFIQAVLDRYQGTRLGKQEIEGLYLENIEGAIFSEENILKKNGPLPIENYDRICVAIDPAVSAGEGSNETGIVVCGSYNDGKNADVLADASGHYTPNEWADLAIHLYKTWKADKVLGEVNNGGDLVEYTLRHAKGGNNIPFLKLHSSRGKRLRAEPVGALYEQHRIWHTQYFELLEDQMVTFNPEDSARKGESPDRVDALVFCLTWLIVERRTARVRFLYA